MAAASSSDRTRVLWESVVMPVLLNTRPRRVALGGARTPLSELLSEQAAAQSFSVVPIGADDRGATPCEVALVGLNGDATKSRRALAALQRLGESGPEIPLVLLVNAKGIRVELDWPGVPSDLPESPWDLLRTPRFPEIGVLVPRRGPMSEVRAVLEGLADAAEESETDGAALDVARELVAYLREQLEATRMENLTLRRELGRARRNGLDQRIEARLAEIESTRLSRELAEVRQRLAALESAASAAADERKDAIHARDELARRLRLLVDRSDELETRTVALANELTEAERQRDALAPSARAAGQELAEARATAQSALPHGRQALSSIRRVRESRAWRWGHGFTRLLRRLTFRRSIGTGGVDAGIRELEELVEVLERSSRAP